MTPTALEELLRTLRRQGIDTSTCEVKRARGGIPAELWRTVSAFANGMGGTILLGVAEQSGFAVTGVDDPGRVERLVADVCSEMEPVVRADIHTVEIEGGNVVSAAIPAIPRHERPCHRRSHGPWQGSYVRVADGNRKLTDYEVARLLNERSEPRHDTSPVAIASLQDLDSEAVERFLSRIRKTRGEIFERRTDEELLRMTNVLVQAEDHHVPSLAGLLAFGAYPQRYEPQLNVTVVVYPNKDPGTPSARGERFLENRSIDGPIPLMVTEAIRVIQRNLSRRTVVAGLLRSDEFEYPEEVLREALVNALVHRDYSEWARGMQVQIELFPDRLVIRNPGGLYGPVDVHTLGTRTITSARNRTLLKLLEDTPLPSGHMVCENRGSGIVRIRAALLVAGMEPPSFQDDIATFEVTFSNHTLFDQEALDWLSQFGDAPLSPPQRTALLQLRSGVALTNSSYRAVTGIEDSRRATKELGELVAQGLAVQHGSRGSARYTLAPGISDGITVGEREQIVLEALAEGRPVPRTELQKITGLERAQLLDTLRKLRDSGLVELVGLPRSRKARWRLRLRS